MPIVNPLPATISTTLAHQRRRVLTLYRDWLRAVPEVRGFRIHYTPTEIRAKIRENFEKNRYLDDAQAVDILIFKGRTELDETINVWKQDDHVERYFRHDTYDQPARKVNPAADKYGRGSGASEFLANFYQGNFAQQQSKNYA